MERLRATIRKYFGFSRVETNGFILLVPLTALIILAPTVYKTHLRQSINITEDSVLTQHLRDEIKSLIQPKNKSKPSKPTLTKDLSPVLFNPNTATPQQLEHMGLSKRLVRIIDNYRAKGGVFRVKKDLSKIYGLDEKSFRQLYDYIDLPETISKQKSNIYNKKAKESGAVLATIKDINSATKDDFVKIRGIGDVLSERIILFRSRLGGFHSLNQLGEVYGLKDSVVMKMKEQFILSDSVLLTQLNIKTATEKELSNHPYISYHLAKLLVAYRDQHDIQSKTQLLGIKVINDSIYQKISPYLK